MEDFFYCGDARAPFGVVGLEFLGSDALLRSLAVTSACRPGTCAAHARCLGSIGVETVFGAAESLLGSSERHAPPATTAAS